MVANAKGNSLVLALVGDIAVSRDDPPSILRYCRDAFRSADVVFGQLEAPLSDRPNPVTPMFMYHGPCRLPAKNITALTKEGARFDAMSLACNHIMDCGYEAFYDTLDALQKSDIPVVGAGRNIAEARRPAIIERKGTRLGFLAYLSIAPFGWVAEEDLPGCAPLRASTYYHPVDWMPGAPPLVVSKLYPGDRRAMEEDIRKLRPQVDVLVVNMHAGVISERALVAMYQKEAAYAAIDAGADLVIQHHSHILRGIETYKGKLIFYGVNHFAFEMGLWPFPERRVAGMDLAWRGFAEGAAPRDPFDPTQVTVRQLHRNRDPNEALKTMIVKVYVQDKKIGKVTYVPAVINPNKEPEVVTRKDPKAQEVFDYVKAISEEAELTKVSFSWDGDEILVA